MNSPKLIFMELAGFKPDINLPTYEWYLTLILDCEPSLKVGIWLCKFCEILYLLIFHEPIMVLLADAWHWSSSVYLKCFILSSLYIWEDKGTLKHELLKFSLQCLILDVFIILHFMIYLAVPFLQDVTSFFPRWIVLLYLYIQLCLIGRDSWGGISILRLLNKYSYIIFRGCVSLAPLVERASFTRPLPPFFFLGHLYWNEDFSCWPLT